MYSQRLVLLFFSFFLMVACTKNSDMRGNSSYTVNIHLTDNPYNAEEVNVDIRSVRLKYRDDNNDDDKDWYTIPTNSRIYNLLNLQNDVRVLLGTGLYPYDRIREIRLLLGENNSIRIDGKLYPLTVPSGSSSGYKIKINKALQPGVNDIIIDFDAELSVHETGNGKYMLRPVLKLK